MRLLLLSLLLVPILAFAQPKEVLVSPWVPIIDTRLYIHSVANQSIERAQVVDVWYWSWHQRNGYEQIHIRCNTPYYRVVQQGQQVREGYFDPSSLFYTLQQQGCSRL